MMVHGAFTTAAGIVGGLDNGLLDRFRSLPMARSAVLAGRSPPHPGSEDHAGYTPHIGESRALARLSGDRTLVRVQHDEHTVRGHGARAFVMQVATERIKERFAAGTTR